MTNVLKLVPKAPPAVNGHAVELVENLLERVKTGEIVACAIVQVAPNGDVGTGWAQDGKSWHRLTSGAATLLHRLAAID